MPKLEEFHENFAGRALKFLIRLSSEIVEQVRRETILDSVRGTTKSALLEQFLQEVYGAALERISALSQSAEFLGTAQVQHSAQSASVSVLNEAISSGFSAGLFGRLFGRGGEWATYGAVGGLFQALRDKVGHAVAAYTASLQRLAVLDPLSGLMFSELMVAP
jgi:hypothetical protein